MHILNSILSNVYEISLGQFITEPTRYREGQRANILDLFITDKSKIVRKVIQYTVQTLVSAIISVSLLS